jgi:uncharacterized membrane protein
VVLWVTFLQAAAGSVVDRTKEERETMSSSNMIQLITQNKCVRWITAGWIAFIAENLILSENRQQIIELINDDNYHRMYSTLSTLACGSIAYGYFVHGRRKGPTIQPPNNLKKFIAFLSQTIGLIGISQIIPLVRMPYTYVDEQPTTLTESLSSSSSELTNPTTKVKAWRCPMDFRSKDLSENDVIGIERISRHAVFWSFGLLTLSGALSTIYVPEIVMFTFPSIFAMIGGAHQDHRFLQGSGGKLTLEKYEKTSNIPFGAILTGKQNLSDVKKELKMTNFSVALGLSVLLGMKRFVR